MTDILEVTFYAVGLHDMWQLCPWLVTNTSGRGRLGCFLRIDIITGDGLCMSDRRPSGHTQTHERGRFPSGVWRATSKDRAMACVMRLFERTAYISCKALLTLRLDPDLMYYLIVHHYHCRERLIRGV